MWARLLALLPVLVWLVPRMRTQSWEGYRCARTTPRIKLTRPVYVGVLRVDHSTVADTLGVDDYISFGDQRHDYSYTFRRWVAYGDLPRFCHNHPLSGGR